MHFYLILEKTQENINVGNTLIFGELFQDQLRQAIYWRRIDEMACMLLQCLAKGFLHSRTHQEGRYFVQRITKKMGLSEYQVKVCYYSGLLHDVGKIAIEDSILKKKLAHK